MTTEQTTGRRVGRPADPGGPYDNYSVSLTPTLRDVAERLGDGNVSLGVRRALLFARQLAGEGEEPDAASISA